MVWIFHALTLPFEFVYNHLMATFFTVIKKIVSVGKKFLLLFTVYFIVISVFLYLINKDKLVFKTQTDPIKKTREKIYQVINDKKINSTKQGKIAVLIYRAITCGFVGEACTNNPTDGDKNFNHSLMGFLGNLIALPYTNPPASGVYWTYAGLQNAGFIPKTFAAEGIGFATIKPFIKIWTVFRNLAFIILVLVMISIGFLIMFRMKINPQTVISVETALPKIVIALLLITFSYPIAGFLIDIMYVFILIITSILSTVNVGRFVPSNTASLFNEYAAAGFSNIYPHGYNLWKAGNYILSILPTHLGELLRGIGSYLVVFGFARLIWHGSGASNIIDALKDIMVVGISIGDLPSLLNAIIGWLLVLLLSPFALPLFIGFLVLLTIIFLMFRVFFLLITNYLQILLLIFFSPVILLFEAIPGKNPFSWWFKTLFANLLVFPVVALLVQTAEIIIKINAEANINQFWSPPFLYPFNQEAMTFLIGVGLFLLIPDLIKILKELLGVKTLPISLGIGTYFGGVGAAWGGLQGGLGGITSLAQVPFIGPKIIEYAREHRKSVLGSLFPMSPTDLYYYDLMKKKANEK